MAKHAAGGAVSALKSQAEAPAEDAEILALLHEKDVVDHQIKQPRPQILQNFFGFLGRAVLARIVLGLLNDLEELRTGDYLVVHPDHDLLDESLVLSQRGSNENGYGDDRGRGGAGRRCSVLHASDSFGLLRAREAPLVLER